MALKKEQTTEIVKKFGRKSDDTGSSEVQVGLLTERIKELTMHLNTHKKDFSSRRGLLKLVAQRRKLLNYLQIENEGKYREISQSLGL